MASTNVLHSLEHSKYLCPRERTRNFGGNEAPELQSNKEPHTLPALNSPKGFSLWIFARCACATCCRASQLLDGWEINF